MGSSFGMFQNSSPCAGHPFSYGRFFEHSVADGGWGTFTFTFSDTSPHEFHSQSYMTQLRQLLMAVIKMHYWDNEL